VSVVSAGLSELSCHEYDGMIIFGDELESDNMSYPNTWIKIQKKFKKKGGGKR